MTRTRFAAQAPSNGWLMAWKLIDGPWLNLTSPMAFRQGDEMTIDTDAPGAVAIYAPEGEDGERVTRVLVRAKKEEK